VGGDEFIGVPVADHGGDRGHGGGGPDEPRPLTHEHDPRRAARVDIADPGAITRVILQAVHTNS